MFHDQVAVEVANLQNQLLRKAAEVVNKQWAEHMGLRTEKLVPWALVAKVQIVQVTFWIHFSLVAVGLAEERLAAMA